MLVLTTCADPSAAEKLAGALVDERLAACVAIGSVCTSIYPWQGKIERERETPLTIKTMRSRLEALEKRLNDLHDYDVPELLVLDVSNGGSAYLDWMNGWVSGHRD